jgi:hypothetical protein
LRRIGERQRLAVEDRDVERDLLPQEPVTGALWIVEDRRIRIRAAGLLVCAAAILIPICWVVDRPWTLRPSSESILALARRPAQAN